MNTNIRITLPLLPIIYVILIIAKFAGVLHWGWFAVITSILWIPIVTFLVIGIVIFAFALLVAAFS